MKLKQHILPVIFVIVYCVISFYFVKESIAHSEKFIEEKAKISELLNFNDRILNIREWIFTDAVWTEKKEQYDAIQDISALSYKKSVENSIYLLITSGIFLVLMIGFYRKGKRFFGLTLAMNFIALVFLIQGISNPVIEIGAYKEDLAFDAYVKPKDFDWFNQTVDYIGTGQKAAGVFSLIPEVGGEWTKNSKEFLGTVKGFLLENADKDFGKHQVFKGKTYFYYQNKGILDVVSLLWNNQNKLVAIAIGLFSIIIPCIKLLLTLYFLFFPFGGQKTKKFLGFIAKWSMADVFVLALFLAYMSFANISAGVQMESNLLYGLYFFGGYVLLSIFLGMFLKKSNLEAKKMPQ